MFAHLQKVDKYCTFHCSGVYKIFKLNLGQRRRIEDSEELQIRFQVK